MPGDGVATLGSEVSLSESHNVIVRYIRFRQGLAEKQDRKSAVNLTNGKQMIFDHVSIEWGRWDTVDMNGCENITFQNCIIGQGVAPQRFGCLCQCDNVTFSHNLFINNQSRNPKAKGKIQYVNNVVYNWGVSGFVGGHSGADHTVDIINNYFIQGPQSSEHFVAAFKPTDHVFQTGNYADLNKDGQLNGRLVVAGDFGAGADAATMVQMPTNPPPVPVATDSAETAFQKVAASAGDSLHRDEVDLRLVSQLKSLGKEGKIVHDPEEDGGSGEIKPTTRPSPLVIDEADVEKCLNDLAVDSPTK